VCGFTEGRGSRRKHFGALLLGAYQQGQLRYYGHSGSGFSERGLADTMERLKPLFAAKSPRGTIRTIIGLVTANNRQN
jgi:bifunctional non-homologous end joining protein LigD